MKHKFAMLFVLLILVLASLACRRSDQVSPTMEPTADIGRCLVTRDIAMTESPTSTTVVDTLTKDTIVLTVDDTAKDGFWHVISSKLVYGFIPEDACR